MSESYRAVDWNRQKRAYDLVLGGVLALAMAVFAVVTGLVSPEVTAETLILRTTAVSAFLLLHVILCIGPLARLDPRFLPLLYNRRHLGVTMAALGTIHAALAVFQFHALGDAPPLWSMLTAYAADARWQGAGGAGLAHFPFEPFGAAAWCVFVLLAATSHDFWLKNLGAPVWKALHTMVYAAYALLLAHTALGVMQTERAAGYPAALGLGWLTVTGLHLAAARRERRRDRPPGSPAKTAPRPASESGWDGWAPVGTAAELIEGRGRVAVAGGRRIALFRHEGRIYALSNVCRHQGGPLGEGRIVDGCVTCPWHGWNYQPADGCSPPPFQEVVPTHAVRVRDGEIWVALSASPLRAVHPGAPVGGERP